jgi:2-dehydro-3-deoxyphosphogluconate aldolase/(4S)-4-hydroxy-2-oxoglutarate aldolase
MAAGGTGAMHPLIPRLRDARIIPVVRTSSAARAATAVAWLQEAGLRIFEITMTVPEAPALIRALAADPISWSAPARSAMRAWPRPASMGRSSSSPLGRSHLAGRAGGRRLPDARRADADRGARPRAGADVVKVFPGSWVGWRM